MMSLYTMQRFVHFSPQDSISSVGILALQGFFMCGFRGGGGGCKTTYATRWLRVRARLLPEYPGMGMRVARASLPRFGALRRDNTPTPACLSISGIFGTECSWSCI